MTLNEENSSNDPNTPAKKTERRRVTRATSSPQLAPVQFMTAAAPAAATPKTTTGNATVVSGDPVNAESTATPPRRSRRVTSSGKASTVGVSGTATEIAAQASTASERVASSQAATTADVTNPVEDDAPKARAPRTRSTTRSRGAKGSAENLKAAASNAALAFDSPVVDATQNPEVSETVATEAVETSTTRSPRRRTTTRTSSEAPANNVAAEPVQEPADVDPAEKRETGRVNDRSRSRSRARRTTTETAAVEPAAAESSPSGTPEEEPKRNTRARRSNVFSDVRTEQPIKAAPVVEEVVPQRPRLATTALLFQAPDLSAVPSRNVGAPIPSAEEAEEETEETTVATEEETSAPRRNSRQRGRNRGRGRQNDVEETEETNVAETEDEEAPTDPELDSQEDNEQDDEDSNSPRRRRRRGGRGRRNRSTGSEASDVVEEESNEDAVVDESDEADQDDADAEGTDSDDYSSSRRRRRRRRRGSDDSSTTTRSAVDEVTALKGSTRLEAKRQRRREGRDAGRRRTIITEAEFLARRESVERSMVVRERDGRTQIAVLEDGVLVEHYVSQQSQISMAGNVYLGRVQNVLPSMEAAFVDIGKGRNAVLYAGEVNWDIHGVDGKPRRIEDALKSGDTVLVQVTKDPIGHKGARLTSQVTLAGRYLVFVPGGGMTGISRKLPDVERSRLKRILRDVVPEGAGVIVRTAAEGASEEELTADIARLRSQWESIEKKSKSASAPALLQGEPDLAIRVVRDIFNDDFKSLKVQGSSAWNEISEYVNELAPDLAERVSKWVEPQDIFAKARIDEQLAKGMDRKVWLPSGGSLVIDRTEAMTVVDVNTGKFTGAGGTLEETVTRNNLEAAEEIVRQLRLRDIGGIIVIDFIDMVLESNRDLVLRRLVECLGRDRTKHQVAEVTSLGLVQMTRKRVGQGLVEAFSTTCDHCNGRGFIVHEEPNEKHGQHTHNNSPAVAGEEAAPATSKRARRKRSNANKDASNEQSASTDAVTTVDAGTEEHDDVKAKLATIAAAASHAHDAEEVAKPVEVEVESVTTNVVEAAEPQVEAVTLEEAVDGPAKKKAKSSKGSKSAGSKSSGSKSSAAKASKDAGDQAEDLKIDGSEDKSSKDKSSKDKSSKSGAKKGKKKDVPALDILAEFGLKED